MPQLKTAKPLLLILALLLIIIGAALSWRLIIELTGLILFIIGMALLLLILKTR
ncbi:MAG: hypothetical protein NXY59_01715 [Aigarchaeota archaeon]|nr:hypothetical protein [Candidatus Pelearchaeum maunauluense]